MLRQVPDVRISNPEQAAQDEEILEKLEHTVGNWASILASVMQKESEKQPIGKGPMAEIDLWRQKNAVLSCLCEQLQLSHVRMVVEVVKIGTNDKNIVSTFTNQVIYLTRRFYDLHD